MSTFTTFGALSQGNPGTAPRVFVASTPSNLGAITTAGYLNDLGDKVKANDVFWINYSDTSTQPPGENATLGQFYAVYSAPNMSLVAFPSGLGTAAGKAASDNTKAILASIKAAPAIGNLAMFTDTVGTIGAATSANLNIRQYTTVAVTAAQFNGMYAAPKLLVAAGGANTLIVLDQVQLLMTYVSANYAAGGVAAVQYDSTVNGAGVIASTTLSAATFQAAASTGFVFNPGVVPETFSTCVNKGLYLSNITGAFTTGDSTFVAHVWYRIIPTV